MKSKRKQNQVYNVKNQKKDYIQEVILILSQNLVSNIFPKNIGNNYLA